MASVPEVPQRKWWIENPQDVPEDDASFLCDVCKHIDFKFVIFETTLMDVREEIPLDTFSKILEKQYCAFCRLIKKTIDNNFGLDALPTQHEGKAVNISMIAYGSWQTFDQSRPRQLLLWVKPNPIDNGETPPLQIQNVHEGHWTDNAGQGRLIPPNVDYLLPLYWNRMCRNGLTSLHKEVPSGSNNHKLPDGFRLIDTEKMCIVPAGPSFEYIALSYVWGKRESLRLFNSNFTELTQENSLSKYADQIPQTIKDAMFLVTRLLDRYLWVDALCIIQDDSEDKKSQISAMDRIYGSSVLTIAAAHGEGAEAGLPGVRPGTRSIIQGIETIQGIRLANRPWSFDKSVGESKWNTRAWTFQERILTKRILYITPQQIFFKCDHVSELLAEDIDVKQQKRKPITYPMYVFPLYESLCVDLGTANALPAGPYPNSITSCYLFQQAVTRSNTEPFSHRDDTGSDTIPERWSINILSYQKTVEYFSTRDITYHGDVLNAFKGIAQKMKPLFRSEFVYGLPLSELDYCLLWEPSGREFCRRRDPETGNPMFPSWSWAGWVGHIRYNWQERLSRVKWVGELNQEFTSDEYRAPYAQDSDANYQAWRKEWTEKATRSDFRYFYHSSDPDVWFRNPVAPEAERNPRLGSPCDPTTGHLRFWAWTIDVVFPKEWQSPKNAAGPFWQFPFGDKNNHIMGHFKVPIEVLPTMNHTKVYDLVVIARTRHGLTREEIKETKGPSEGDKKTSTLTAENSAKNEELSTKKPLEDYDDEKDVTLEENFFPDETQSENSKWDLSFDRQRFDAYKPFCLYEFLLVEWIDGVAYRIGHGKAHIDAWVREDPKWKLITLG